MCSDESLLQEDRSLSAGLSGLHLRDASGQTNRSSRLAPIQSHDILSSNPSPLNQRYHINFLIVIRCAQVCVTEVTPLLKASDQQPAGKGACSPLFSGRPINRD
jgi:hypothetical protein